MAAVKDLKLENGKQTPTDDDIREWTAATSAENETESLLASLHTLESQHADWQRLLRTGVRAHQRALRDQDAKVHFYRVFESMVIPGLLQVPEYARVALSRGEPLHGPRGDVDDAVHIRMQRQATLYQSNCAFTSFSPRPRSAIDSANRR